MFEDEEVVIGILVEGSVILAVGGEVSWPRVVQVGVSVVVVLVIVFVVVVGTSVIILKCRSQGWYFDLVHIQEYKGIVRY